MGGKVENKKDPNVCHRKRTCAYGRNLGSMYCCDYLGITGKPRPCDVKDCTEYKRKIRRKKNGK